MHTRPSGTTAKLVVAALFSLTLGGGIGLAVGSFEDESFLFFLAGTAVALTLIFAADRFGIASLKGYSVGEVGLVSLFFILLAVWIHFWQSMHKYEYPKTFSDMECWARTTGQVASLFIALLSLPTARSSVWSMIFGVSWEAGVRFHRVLGYGALVASIMHQVLWWKVYAANSDDACAGQLPKWPRDIFAIPLCFHADDWVVPAMFFVWVFMLIGMGIFAHEYFRRNHFELFYYTHHIYMVIYVAVLIQAPSLWYYLIGGLSLWMLDRVIRFQRGCRQVQIKELKALPGAITHLKVSYSGKAGISYAPGQYCFLNIPEISSLQLHPFSISSAPCDGSSTLDFHIKNMGEDTFTGTLQTLARNSNSMETSLSVDGPYGTPIEFARYQRIVFVAGGIGITPAHSNFRHIVKQALTPDAGVSVPEVHLSWIFQNQECFLGVPAVSETLHEIAELNSVSMPMEYEEFPATFSLVATREEGQDSTACGLPLVCMSSRDINFIEEISSKSPLGAEARTLVFACGPKSLLEGVSDAAMALGYDFHAETFEL